MPFIKRYIVAGALPVNIAGIRYRKGEEIVSSPETEREIERLAMSGHLLELPTPETPMPLALSEVNEDGTDY